MHSDTTESVNFDLGMCPVYKQFGDNSTFTVISCTPWHLHIFGERLQVPSLVYTVIGPLGGYSLDGTTEVAAL